MITKNINTKMLNKVFSDTFRKTNSKFIYVTFDKNYMNLTTEYKCDFIKNFPSLMSIIYLKQTQANGYYYLSVKMT